MIKKYLCVQAYESCIVVLYVLKSKYIISVIDGRTTYSTSNIDEAMYMYQEICNGIK